MTRPTGPTLRELFNADPHTLPPAALRLARLSARVACWTAPVLLAGFIGAAAAHFLLPVGNYPTPAARQTVGALFLFLFAPVTAVIWLLARQRRRALDVPSDPRPL